MKLKNSVNKLKYIVQDNIQSVGMDNVKQSYINCDYRVSKDSAFLWLIWWNIKKDVRESIIELSIHRDEWVGGYADYSDAQLLTLLRKSVPLDEIKAY